MKRNRIILILLFFISGCRLNLPHSDDYLTTEKQKIETCRENWKYMDLPNKVDIRILHIDEKFQTTLSTFPCFIIGSVANSDTIGIIDKDFNGQLAINDVVSVDPTSWTNEEKEMIVPCLTVSPNSKDNDLQCTVQNVFFGKIVLH